MSHPLISVVIPTCHRNDLLAKCLDCLAPGTQTLPAESYEVVVTDDGSRSTAEEMLREKYSWARWTSGPRRGPAANRNHGAQVARYEWLAFTDDDCLPEPNWLQAYAEAITTGTHVYEGKTVCKAGLHSPLETSPLNPTGGYLWSCNMMVRRSLFQELGGFDEGFPAACCEDIEFQERLSRREIAFRFVADALIDHPPRPKSWGVRQGAMRESEVRLWYLTRRHGATGVRLIGHTLKWRLRELRGHRLSLAWFSWMISSAVELCHVARHVGQWDVKHKPSE